MRRSTVLGIWLLTMATAPATGLAAPKGALHVHPLELRLESPESSEQLLVSLRPHGGRKLDVTRQAAYSTSGAGVVRVSDSGRVVPLRDGRTQIRVAFQDQVARVVVEVKGMALPPPISFRRDVEPILSKAGCNSGGCHGKAEGQNGFRLSVFGYDAEADHQAIVREGRGRRVFPAAPERSLLLLKATAETPHGGGQRIPGDSRWYRRLRRWIAEGVTLEQTTVDPLVSIAVEPSEVVLGPRGSQQLRVTARYQSGRQHCATAEAEYESNQEAIAAVDREGLIQCAEVPGEAAILVRYLGQVAVCRVTRPRDAEPFARPPERNFIDRLVWDKLERLGIEPSPPADDATFLRRVFLDTIGTLPTADEVRRFLADRAEDKRQRRVTSLLDRREYADYWAQRWSDLLQVDKDTITPQGAVAMTRWIREQLADNVRYDAWVRTLLTAQGSTLGQTPAAFYQVQDDPEKLARAVSQLLLGVRIECAQCHHHPFERWDQHDYFALAGFFTGVQRKPHPLGGIKITATPGADLKHPRTGQLVPAAGLGAPPPDLAGARDRRAALADWMTSPANPYFARALANRLWAHYFGRGLVEPVDDLRATNPASNEPLLDALADHLVALDYDLKAFTRTLLDSHVYQLSSRVHDANRLDDQNHSHAPWKPMPAEVLLDAVSQATGVAERFNGWPAGYRAIQIWDNKLPSHFLEVFGRPSRQTVCACERGTEPSIAQALHLMNAANTMGKIQDRDGRAAELAASNLTPDQIIEELYLVTLSRYPDGAERQLMRRAFERAANRREATEDVLWTLLNTKEFVYCH